MLGDAVVAEHNGGLFNRPKRRRSRGLDAAVSIRFTPVVPPCVGPR